MSDPATFIWPGKAEEDGLVLETLHHCGKPGRNLGFLTSDQPSPAYCSHLDSELADRRYYLSITAFGNSALQMKISL